MFVHGGFLYLIVTKYKLTVWISAVKGAVPRDCLIRDFSRIIFP
jgi:hypothetical protein